MGLSFDGRTGGAHGRDSPEVGRAEDVQHGVQADDGPANVLYTHELGWGRSRPRRATPRATASRGRSFYTSKRDCLNGADILDAEAVLAQLGEWLEDYNRQASHSTLGMRRPSKYRATLTLAPPSA
jgi:transposase InsO family protein